MRFITITFALLMITMSVNAQFSKNSITYKLIGVDYETPLVDGYSLDIQGLNKGVDFAYNRSLTDALDLVVPFRLGTAAVPGVIADGFVKSKRIYAGLDATVKFKFAEMPNNSNWMSIYGVSILKGI